MAQLTLRIDDSDLPRVEGVSRALAAKLGTGLARSDVLRVIFTRGLVALEGEHEIAPVEKGERPARKPKGTK